MYLIKELILLYTNFDKMVKEENIEITKKDIAPLNQPIKEIKVCKNMLNYVKLMILKDKWKLLPSFLQV